MAAAPFPDDGPHLAGWRRRQVAAALALGAMSPWSRAADFPERTVTIVSPFAAGGANDFLSRLMAQRLGEAMKASFVVENRTGANGNVGAAYVAKSPPDGHVLLMGNSATHGTNPTLYPDQPYDALKDFAPVGMVAAVPIVIVVNPNSGIQTVADLLAQAKARPGKMGFGSSGIGGTGHLCGEAFKAATGMDVVHVPYKGDAPAATDVMGGQVDVAFIGMSSATGPAQGGKLRIIAVAHGQRVAALPQVPTLAEAGHRQLEFSQWYALFARAGTPAASIERLSQAQRAVLARDDVQKAMVAQGAETISSTPDGLATFSRNEIARFRAIIQRLNIKV